MFELGVKLEHTLFKLATCIVHNIQIITHIRSHCNGFIEYKTFCRVSHWIDGALKLKIVKSNLLL